MVTPDKAGRLTAEITIASSEKDAKKVSAIIDASECRDIVVVTSPASSSVCKGEIAAYDITVKNRGAMDDTITLSSTSGSLNINKVVLAAGESKTVQLNVDTSSMEGAKKIEITATDGKVSDKSSVDLNVEACRLAELSIEPSNKTICPFTGFNYTITLANKGKFSDTFTMKFKDVTESATLAPGQSESWSIPVYAEESGAYSLTATAESNSTKAGAATVLVVQPVGKCYSVEIKSDKEAIAEVLKANTVKLTIKNTGSVKDSYVLSVDGPSWAYVSPEVIELEPGISADAYLYISPARESDNSTTNVVVNVKSNNAAASSTISAIVGNGGQGGGLGSISFSNITGSIISESGDRPFWKVAVVVLITLAIIIILFVRFVLLVK